MLADKPWSHVRRVLDLKLEGEMKEVAVHPATAALGPTVTWPDVTGRHVDAVITRDLVVGRDQSPREQHRSVWIIAHPGIGITAVVQVAIGRADQHHFAMGIVAMIPALAELRAQRCGGCELANDVDSVDYLERGKWSARKQAQSLDYRRACLDDRRNTRAGHCSTVPLRDNG